MSQSSANPVFRIPEPSNIDSAYLRLFVSHREMDGRARDVQPSNMCDMSSTFITFHFLSCSEALSSKREHPAKANLMDFAPAVSRRVMENSLQFSNPLKMLSRQVALTPGRTSTFVTFFLKLLQGHTA